MGNSVQKLTSIDKALSIIKNNSKLLNTEKLPLDQAYGRILASDIPALINNPSFDNSAIDGIAVSNETFLSLQNNPNLELSVKKQIFAGDKIDKNITLKTNECLHIMTGAMVPKNIITIFYIENTTYINNTTVKIKAPFINNANIRKQGEDYKIGALLIPKGIKIKHNDIMLLASCGIAELLVFKKPKVAVFTTGKETKNLNEELEEGQIYNSNFSFLNSFLSNNNFEIVLTKNIPDNITDLKQAVIEAINCKVDLIISAGAVSMGEEDIVKTYLLNNSKILYNGLKLRPGKPNMLGLINDKILYFGTPGNPISCAVALQILVMQYYRSSNNINKDYNNYHSKAILNHNFKKKAGFSMFMRGFKTINDAGMQQVNILEKQGSHMISAYRAANCLVKLPEIEETFQAGTVVEIYDI